MIGETSTTDSHDERIIVLLGEKYYRSDLAAQMMQMHTNTLLQKGRQGKIKRFRHKHAYWFKEVWMKAYLDKESQV